MEIKHFYSAKCFFEKIDGISFLLLAAVVISLFTVVYLLLFGYTY